MTKWTAFFRKFRQQEQGFTLLEVALVLAVIGIMAGTLLPLLSTFVRKQALQNTTTRQQVILDNLAIFVAREGRLPCPAQLRGKEPFGAENGSGRRGEDTPEKCLVSQGIVPFRTIGLSEQYYLDGWNNAFTYAIPKTLGTTKDITAFCTAEISEKDQLQVKDQQGLPYAVKDMLAVVLLSHGENGHGSYLLEQPGKRARPVPRAEQENADNDTTFQVFQHSTGDRRPYDDLIKWHTRDQLVAWFKTTTCTNDEVTPEQAPAETIDNDGNISGTIEEET